MTIADLDVKKLLGYDLQGRDMVGVTRAVSVAPKIGGSGVTQATGVIKPAGGVKVE